MDQYFVESVSEAQKKQILAAIVSRDSGGSVSLSDDVTRKVKFDLAMPLIGNIANLNVNADIQKHTTVTITAGKTFRRTVNWDAIRDAHEKNQLTQIMHEQLLKRISF